MTRVALLKNRGRLAALALPVLFIGTLYIYLYFLTRNGYEKDMEQSYVALLNRLSDSLQVHTNDQAVSWLSQALMTRDEVLYSVLLDRNNRMQQLISKEDYLENYLFISNTQPMDYSRFRRISRPQGQAFYHLMYPVHSPSRLDAADSLQTGDSSTLRNASWLILLGISAQPIEDYMQTWFNSSFPGALLFALGFALVGYWFANSVLSPLSAVAKNAQTALQNNSQFAPMPIRHDEIGVISDSLKRLSNALQENRQQNQAFVQSMETRIQRESLKLKESEQKYRMLFKYSGTGFTLVSPDGTLNMVNRQFEKLSGYVKEELERKKKFTDFFNEPDRSRLQSLFGNNGKILGLQHTQSIECQFVDRQARKHDINLTLNLVLDSSHLLASIADVTEFRDLQKRLNRSENLASIGELAASIGHEIRNPLGAINTSVEVLQNSLQLEGEDRELMDIIAEETKRLDLIISDFLQFARLNKARFRKVDVNRLISETLLLFKEKMGPNIDKQIDLYDPLPEIDADNNQLKQVLVNIIINALEAMPKGGKLIIRTRPESPGPQVDRLLISVRDNGEGIIAEHLKKIFHPFYSTKERGVGMGLAICDRIIQNHGGEIAVKSKPEEGTEFILTLPVHNGTV